MSWMRAAPFVLLVLAVSGCGEKANKNVAAPGTPAVGNDAELFFVAATRPLLIAASLDEVVPHPGDPSSLVGNLLGVAHRGQKVRLLREQSGLAYVQLDGETSTRWLPHDALMPVHDTELATLVEDAAAFEDGAAVRSTGEMIAKGTLLFVLETGAKAARVNVGLGREVWLETGALSFAEADVRVSQMISQIAAARAYQNETLVGQLFDKIRLEYPQSPLIDAAGDEVPTRQFHAVPQTTTSLGVRPPDYVTPPAVSSPPTDKVTEPEAGDAAPTPPEEEPSRILLKEKFSRAARQADLPAGPLTIQSLLR